MTRNTKRPGKFFSDLDMIFNVLLKPTKNTKLPCDHQHSSQPCILFSTVSNLKWPEKPNDKWPYDQEPSSTNIIFRVFNPKWPKTPSDRYFLLRYWYHFTTWIQNDPITSIWPNKHQVLCILIYNLNLKWPKHWISLKDQLLTWYYIRNVAWHDQNTKWPSDLADWPTFISYKFCTHLIMSLDFAQNTL